MAKKLIRLTESDLHRIVKESVKRILKEESYGQRKARYDAKKWFKLWKSGNPSTKGVITPEIMNHLGRLDMFRDDYCQDLGMKALENLYSTLRYDEVPPEVMEFAETAGKTIYDLLWHDNMESNLQ